MRRVVMTCLSVVAMLSLWVTPAYAKGGLLASEPRPNQELKAAPGWVTLAFDHPINMGVAKLVVLAPTGENVVAGKLTVEGTNLMTQLRSGLGKGTYTVLYRIDATDGDIEGGSFQFSYGSGSWTQAKGITLWKGEAKQPAILADPRPRPAGSGTFSQTPLPSPSDPVSESASPSASPSDSPVPSEVPSPSPSPSTAAGDSGSSAPLLWGLGTVVLAAAIGGGVVLARRNRSAG